MIPSRQNPGLENTQKRKKIGIHFFQEVIYYSILSTLTRFANGFINCSPTIAIIQRGIQFFIQTRTLSKYFDVITRTCHREIGLVVPAKFVFLTDDRKYC